MRVLNARTFEFVEFYDSSTFKYAILSHTWRHDEVLLKDIEHGFEAAQRKAGWHKIESACGLALSQGLHWVWIDTCCIDKSSSAELSEAINSMFRWYANAAVCYAFLDDVPAGSKIDSICPPFANARWFTRGWTLQELIAPSRVEFYVVDGLISQWRFLGTKDDLADILSDITRVPAPYLCGRSLAVASIAQRMSWASRRSTTRDEDTAYCLLGIFDVNMPLLYGEGEKAFLRLQEEIVRTSPDQFLLAWGLHPEGTGHIAVQAQRGMHKNRRYPADDEIGGIFASHPSWFRDSHRIHPYVTAKSDIYELSNQGLRISSPLPSFHSAQHEGVELTYACIDCYDGNFLDRIAIPLHLDSNGRYYRLLPSFASPLSVEHLSNSLVAPVSAYARSRTTITISRHVDVNAHTQQPEWDSGYPCEYNFVLRLLSFEVRRVYPESGFGKDKRLISVPGPDGLRNVTLFLQPHSQLWGLLINLGIGFPNARPMIRCRVISLHK